MIDPHRIDAGPSTRTPFGSAEIVAFPAAAIVRPQPLARPAERTPRPAGQPQRARPAPAARPPRSAIEPGWWLALAAFGLVLLAIAA